MRRQTQKWSAVLAAAAAVVAVAAVAETLGAQAKVAAPGHHAAPREPNAPSCTAARTICAFSGPNGTGREFEFATSDNHSHWTDFKKVTHPSGAAPFHPDSIINNSGSDIWVYDSAAAAKHSTVAGPYCAFGSDSTHIYNFSDWVPVDGGTKHQGYVTRAYQPGWFFIQYNVNACATRPSAALP
jgi:Peptidase inhibitor family I36